MTCYSPAQLRKLLIIAVVVVCAWMLAVSNHAASSLIDEHSADTSTDGHLLANGMLGAMVLGTYPEERIVFNHAQAWTLRQLSDSSDLATTIQADSKHTPAKNLAVLDPLGSLRIRHHIPSRPDVLIQASNWRRSPVTTHSAWDPQWIEELFDDSDWAQAKLLSDFSIPEDSTVVFRYSFTLSNEQIQHGLSDALLESSPCDDSATFYLNGVKAGHISTWQEPLRTHTNLLKPGRNVLAVVAKNYKGPGSMSTTCYLHPRKGRMVDYQRKWHLDNGLSEHVFQSATSLPRIHQRVVLSRTRNIMLLSLRSDTPIDLDISWSENDQLRISQDQGDLVVDNTPALTMHSSATPWQIRIRAVNEGPGNISTRDNQIQLRQITSISVRVSGHVLPYREIAPVNVLSYMSKNTLDKLEDISTEQLIEESTVEHKTRMANFSLAIDSNKKAVMRLMRSFDMGRYIIATCAHQNTPPPGTQGLWNETPLAPGGAGIYIPMLPFWIHGQAAMGTDSPSRSLEILTSRILPDARAQAQHLKKQGALIGSRPNMLGSSGINCLDTIPPINATLHGLDIAHLYQRACEVEGRAWQHDTQTQQLLRYAQDVYDASPHNITSQWSIAHLTQFQKFKNDLTRKTSAVNLPPAITQTSLSELHQTHIPSPYDIWTLCWPNGTYHPNQMSVEDHAQLVYYATPPHYSSPSILPASHYIQCGLALSLLRAPEEAWRCLQHVLKHNTDNHGIVSEPPFSPVDNAGIVALVASFLAQSDGQVLELLPALPDMLRLGGTANNLSLKHGLSLDISWKHGQVTSLTLRSSQPQHITIQWPNGKNQSIELSADNPYQWQAP